MDSSTGQLSVQPPIRKMSLGFGLLLVIVGVAGVLDGIWDVELAQVASIGLLAGAAAFLVASRLRRS